MEIVKLLKDYSKNQLEKELNEYFTQQFDSCICHEKITNIEYMIKYVQPVNDFIIHTTAKPCMNTRRIVY